MSDDEEDYYDDDDLDEYFWIEDAEPGIAVSSCLCCICISMYMYLLITAGGTSQDGLAETSHLDAVVIEDPSLEVEDYFSDWAEHSDDYFDDDPAPTQRAASARATATAAGGGGRSSGRRQHTPQHTNATTAFEGVIWKKTGSDVLEQADPGSLFEPGHGEKVALLRNWREVFKISQPSSTGNRLRGRASVARQSPPARGGSALVVARGYDRGGGGSSSSSCDAAAAAAAAGSDNKPENTSTSSAAPRLGASVASVADDAIPAEDSMAVPRLKLSSAPASSSSASGSAGNGYAAGESGPLSPLQGRGTKRKASVAIGPDYDDRPGTGRPPPADMRGPKNKLHIRQI